MPIRLVRIPADEKVGLSRPGYINRASPPTFVRPHKRRSLVARPKAKAATTTLVDFLRSTEEYWMLTDIFARRYENRPLFTTVGPREQALFVQAYRLINEQIFPYYGYDKKIDEKAKATWTSLHDRLTMELGLKELSAKYYSYQGEWMGAYFSPSWTAFQGDGGRDFSVIVDGVSV